MGDSFEHLPNLTFEHHAVVMAQQIIAHDLATTLTTAIITAATLVADAIRNKPEYEAGTFPWIWATGESMQRNADSAARIRAEANANAEFYERHPESLAQTRAAESGTGPCGPWCLDSGQAHDPECEWQPAPGERAWACRAAGYR